MNHLSLYTTPSHEQIFTKDVHIIPEITEDTKFQKEEVNKDSKEYFPRGNFNMREFYGGINNNISNIYPSNFDGYNQMMKGRYQVSPNQNPYNMFMQNQMFSPHPDVYLYFMGMNPQNNLMNMNMNMNLPMYDMLKRNQMTLLHNNQIYQNIKPHQGMFDSNNNNTNNNYSNNYTITPLMKKSQYETAIFDDIYRLIPEICKDHSESKIFTKIYEEATDDQKQKIINKILPEVYSLSKEVFGNYIIQHFLTVVSQENKKAIIAQLYNKIKELSLHKYGCRVIQKAIEVADENDVIRHLTELQNDLIKCIQDQNGNHVVQKLIEKLTKGKHIEIINTIKGRVYQLSIHQYGCRVIQRIFDFCLDSEKDIILKEIYERIHELCLDQYGNYVIQNILEKINNSNIIYEGLKGKVFEYSKHKFASNVVEKCLSLGTKAQTAQIVKEIIEQDNKTNDALQMLVKDKYGNYVIQKMLEVADMKSKEILVKKIFTMQSMKKKDGFSKHVIQMIDKLGLSSHLDQLSLNQINYDKVNNNQNNFISAKKK